MIATVLFTAGAFAVIAPLLIAIAGRGGAWNVGLFCAGCVALLCAVAIDPHVGQGSAAAHQRTRPDACRADQYRANEALCRIWGYPDPR